MNPVINGQVIGPRLETHFKAGLIKEEIELPDPSSILI
jgi:hypothetical protein